MSICSLWRSINEKASINYSPSFYYGERLEEDISILVKDKKVTDSSAKVAIPHDDNPVNSPWKLKKGDWNP